MAHRNVSDCTEARGSDKVRCEGNEERNEFEKALRQVPRRQLKGRRQRSETLRVP